MPDRTIAAVLNRSGKSTGCGASWTRSRVCSVRYQKEIAVSAVPDLRASCGKVSSNHFRTASKRGLVCCWRTARRWRLSPRSRRHPLDNPAAPTSMFNPPIAIATHLQLSMMKGLKARKFTGGFVTGSIRKWNGQRLSAQLAELNDVAQATFDLVA
jgi:hypothetical protein